MASTNQTSPRPCAALCAALHQLCAAAYAILPRDVAHRVGEFEQNVWGAVGWFADKKIGWIEEALADGDRLREAWQRRRAPQQPHVTEQQ